MKETRQEGAQKKGWALHYAMEKKTTTPVNSPAYCARRKKVDPIKSVAFLVALPNDFLRPINDMHSARMCTRE